MSALIRALSPGPRRSEFPFAEASSSSLVTKTTTTNKKGKNSNGNNNKEQIEANNLKDLATDLGDLFSKSTLTDAVVYAEGQPIHVHKSILAARSAIFGSIFERLSRENRPNVILINDLSYDVVKELITFTYSGKVGSISLELLTGAERYEIKGLKNICSNHIIKQLSVANSIETLITAHVNKCSDLEAAAVKFVSHHWKNVRREHSFNMLSNWPVLLIKIIDTLAKV